MMKEEIKLEVKNILNRDIGYKTHALCI